MSGYFPQIGATVVRARVRETVGFFNEDFIGGQDWDWQLRIARQHGVGFVRQPCVLFAQRETGTYDSLQLRRAKFTRRIFLRNAIPEWRVWSSPIAFARSYFEVTDHYFFYFTETALDHANKGERRLQFVNLAGVHDVSVACVAEAALGQLVEGRFAGDLGRCESRQVIRLTVKMNSQERNRRILNTDHLNKDIGRRAARGGIIAIAAQPIRMFMQFFITAVLARLLAPDAFGLVAMATAVTGFVALFSELGLTSATVQRHQVDQDMVSGLFFIGLGVSIVLVPIVCAFAPIAAWFFGDPRVSGLIFLMSLSFPLAALGSQHTALLLRSMRWMELQWTGLVGHAVGGLAGILVAWKTDLGYWSLAVTTLVAQIVTLALIWWACRWRPSLVADWRGARSGLHFGAYLAGFSVVNFFHRQLDNIIVGWRFGATELGFYSRGYQLMLLPLNLFNGPLSAAIEPSLSRLQNEPERWRQAFLDALGLLCSSAPGWRPA